MENSGTTMIIKDTTANPAPLGLLGFGMTTVLLNLHNAGLYELNSMIIGMGIFVGGLAQVIAGVQEWKKNNTFGATAFTAYGFFWLSLVAIWLIPKTGMGDGLKSSESAMGWYLLMWGLFTSGMFIGTLKLNVSLRVIFSTLALLFFLLAIGDFTGSKEIKVLAGIEGVFCGLSAVYTCIAIILDGIYHRRLLPY